MKLKKNVKIGIQKHVQGRGLITLTDDLSEELISELIQAGHGHYFEKIKSKKDEKESNIESN